MPAFGSMSHLNHKLHIKDWCSQLWRHPLVFAHCKLKVQFYFHGHQLVSFAQPELAELDEGFSYLGYASIKAWLGLLQGSFVDPADVTYTSGWCHLRHCRLIMCYSLCWEDDCYTDKFKKGGEKVSRALNRRITADACGVDWGVVTLRGFRCGSQFGVSDTTPA